MFDIQSIVKTIHRTIKCVPFFFGYIHKDLQGRLVSLVTGLLKNHEPREIGIVTLDRNPENLLQNLQEHFLARAGLAPDQPTSPRLE